MAFNLFKLFKGESSYFLDLSDGETKQVQPASVAPAPKVESEEKSEQAPEPGESKPPISEPTQAKVVQSKDVASTSLIEAVKEKAPVTADAPEATPQEQRLTTAEQIAAELAAAQASRPAVRRVTFAPDSLAPTGALPRRRRKAGANLATFKTMAKEMTRS